MMLLTKCRFFFSMNSDYLDQFIGMPFGKSFIEMSVALIHLLSSKCHAPQLLFFLFHIR